MTSSLANISLNSHGALAVQKLIDLLATYQSHVRIVATSLKPDILILIKDVNGNYVVQRCVNSLNNSQNQFIYNVAGDYMLEIATGRHGCCVLQRCIAATVEKIIGKAVELVQDAFGKYVVQYGTDLNSENINAKLAFIF